MAWFWPVPLVALDCSWWDWEEHLSFSFPEVRSLDGGIAGLHSYRGAVWPGGSCQGKSVCRSHAVGGGRGSRQLWAGAQNQKRKKKSQKVQLWPVLGPSFCNPASAGQCRHGSRVAPPACIRNSITSSAVRYATYSPAVSPNSKIRKPSAPVPALHVCVPCACACAPACL